LRNPFFIVPPPPQRTEVMPMARDKEVSYPLRVYLFPDATKKSYPTGREVSAPHVRSNPDGQASVEKHGSDVPDSAD